MSLASPDSKRGKRSRASSGSTQASDAQDELSVADCGTMEEDSVVVDGEMLTFRCVNGWKEGEKLPDLPRQRSASPALNLPPHRLTLAALSPSLSFPPFLPSGSVAWTAL